MTHSGSNWELHVGDCRKILQELPEGSVQCCVTSPPYWGLRDYGNPPLVWGDWSGSLGLEPTIEMFLDHMVEVFAGVWRVLRDDGVCWVNLGDSMNGSGGQGSQPIGPKASLGGVQAKRAPGLKPKDCCLIPERFVLAMQAAGWYVRSKITWCKKAPMPESCRDRPTNATEMVYLFSKRAHYFYDFEAGKVQAKYGYRDTKGEWRGGAYVNQKGPQNNSEHKNQTNSVTGGDPSTGRNLWNYWNDLGQSRFSGAHFATFPIGLPLRCIKLGTSERGCCPECGSPWQRVLRQKFMKTNSSTKSAKKGTATAPECGWDQEGCGHNETTTTGWQPGCDCDHDHEPIETGHATVPCTVLDLFSGSHTTGIAALQLGRRYVGIELSEKYAGDYAYRLHDPYAYATTKRAAQNEKTTGFGLSGTQ